MKGYRKELRKFIEYVLSKYGKDEEVKSFRATYETHKAELERKRETKAVATTTKISLETAKLCRDLIIFELTKQSIMNYANIEYLTRLQKANAELLTVSMEVSE